MIGINIQKPKRLLSHAVAARGLEEHYHLQNVIFFARTIRQICWSCAAIVRWILAKFVGLCNFPQNTSSTGTYGGKDRRTDWRINPGWALNLLPGTYLCLVLDYLLKRKNSPNTIPHGLEIFLHVPFILFIIVCSPCPEQLLFCQFLAHLAGFLSYHHTE